MIHPENSLYISDTEAVNLYTMHAWESWAVDSWGKIKAQVSGGRAWVLWVHIFSPSREAGSREVRGPPGAVTTFITSLVFSPGHHPWWWPQGALLLLSIRVEKAGPGNGNGKHSWPQPQTLDPDCSCPGGMSWNGFQMNSKGWHYWKESCLQPSEAL